MITYIDWRKYMIKKKYNAEIWDTMQYIFSDFNDHQIHCVINFDNHIDELCLKKSLKKSKQLFPLIGANYVETFFKAYWQEGDFNVDDIVKIIETKYPENEIENFVVSRTYENIGSQVLLLIARSEIKDSICIIINHMLCDGAGFKDYIAIVASIYSSFKAGEDIKAFEIGSRNLEAVFNNYNIFKKIKILSSSSKLSKYNSKVSMVFDKGTEKPFIVRQDIDKGNFIAIKKYAKAMNATVNDIIVAAYIRVLDKFLNIKGVPIPCALNLRKYVKDEKLHLTNFTSNLICDLGEEIGENFDETLLKVKKTMDKEKNKYSPLKPILMLEIIFKIFPYKIAKYIVMKNFKNPLIAMTNIGIIDNEKINFYGLKVLDAFMTGSIKKKPYFQISATTFNNKLTLCINLLVL